MDRNKTLSRDLPTWLVYLQLATFATYLYGMSAALPTLRDELGVSQAVAGLHGTGMAVGGIVGGLFLPALVARFGRRAITWAGLTGMNAGVLIVMFGHALPYTLLGYTVAGGCGSMALYAVMAVLSDHHGAAGPAAISEANAFGVIAGIAVTYVFSLMAGSTTGWRPALGIPVAATVLLALIMGRVWVPTPASTPVPISQPSVSPTSSLSPAPPAPATSPAPSAAAAPRVPYGWRFHLAGAVLLCCVALEFSFNLWAVELFAQRTGLPVGDAAKGLTAMLAGMAVGRFGGARLTLRMRPSSVLLGALVVALAGWALFWTGTSEAAGYAGLALSGMGISVHFPLALTLIIDTSAGRPDRATGTASIWAGVGAGGGPFVLGALGDGFGTHTAFLLAPVLIALALTGLAAGGGLSARRRS
ncbi:MFS transporter [Sphaerimonospora thailandensis]|uniref:Major facilitator superfamily (MFS) profile domain-containing protein n=1 Tax=Sphaerimonospora thailandensis TaxID=795644 RepID=A0A8J3R7I4_9ACTN|nr:MFS transporter [Sphaerimonospora thailandensis]GIH69878.1 hypothetical protein Mth01_21310 [Sphaerimonospora thailandensis]